MATAELTAASASVPEPVVFRGSRWQRNVKRGIDIAGAGVALLFASPLLPVLALAVLVCDGRPVFFPWDVVGENGRRFRGWKFRTMVPGADAQRDALADRNEMRGPVFKMRNDPRVTRLGAILRRYSLDELPQLWSVVRGDMSLVGPRPLFPEEYERATPGQRRKLSVKPGITCLWQVMGRSGISDFEEWVALDLCYIEQWSLWLDMKILWRTVPTVLGGRGAW